VETYQRLPKTLARSPGRYHEFVTACRGGPPAGTDSVAHPGLLTGVCLLGNAALRAGGKFSWDSANLRFANAPGANKFLHREYRQGWTL
jgi:hypothetical protein